jgi:hypothetical protein
MKMPLSTQQAAVLIAAMAFVFLWVHRGMGDVESAMAALSAGALGLWGLFQKLEDR